ncbi:NADPH:quinone reductase [Pseudonocardia xinjiangensis]|uniref:NADPH:quinone reductase n=1 Tax=Pseudonocardia xinjiangensis TaxID=75289 RepID=A0ABX1RIA4_9PSEU|nr:NADPH:quinone reductase [Pseudonocardia xinjiangensis]NMH79551.1 NADPH:quinone reductase [Pseudonocardia xinjiangensis]
MRAVMFTDPGPASVLHLVERPIPVVGPGEVRVRVVVSGVNPTDVGARSGRGTTDGTLGPHVPNQDGAGIVDAVGPGVPGLTVGDRVWMWDAAWLRSDGTAQEYVVLPRRHVVPLPDGVSFDVGAALGIPALTAHRALTSAAEGPARLEPGALKGKVVFVVGGAGAVGNAAVQLATWAGARVLTTVTSDAKAALASAAGADHVIRASDDVGAAVRRMTKDGLDVIVEVAPTENLDLDVEMVAPGGTIALYTAGREPTIPIPWFPSMVKNVQFQFILTYTTSVQQKDDAVAAVSAAVAARAFDVGEQHGLPLARFPLERTREAHEAVEHHWVGKVLVDVSS